MRSLTVLRNCCAHHSRLWNRRLANSPQMKATLRGAWVDIAGLDNNKVYAIFCCVAYWLESFGHGQAFKAKLKGLLSAYSQVDTEPWGFQPIGNSSPFGSNKLYFHTPVALREKKLKFEVLNAVYCEIIV